MDAERVRTSAFAMPLTNPSYLPGHYRIVDRQYLIITYRSDPEAIGRVLPEPLEVTRPLVHCEFIRMPDTTGFGDYTRGQVIPVRFRGVDGSYSHATYVNDEVPIAGGRELWGFPKKLADPSLTVDKDRYNGTIHDLVMLNALADTPAAKGAIQQANDTLGAALHRSHA